MVAEFPSPFSYRKQDRLFKISVWGAEKKRRTWQWGGWVGGKSADADWRLGLSPDHGVDMSASNLLDKAIKSGSLSTGENRLGVFFCALTNTSSHFLLIISERKERFPPALGNQPISPPVCLGATSHICSPVKLVSREHSQLTDSTFCLSSWNKYFYTLSASARVQTYLRSPKPLRFVYPSMYFNLFHQDSQNIKINGSIISPWFQSTFGHSNP